MAVKSGAGGRRAKVRVTSARRRTPSSARWLARQLNDPYVHRAKAQGYRSRAAYKLIELDDRFGFLGPGKSVIDLGAAPGGWTQVAVERVRAGRPGGGRVVALDVAPMPAVAGAAVLCGDLRDAATPAALKAALGGTADVVLSDMAAPATGHAGTDSIRVIALAEAALEFALDVLAPGGTFVAKIRKGGGEHELLGRLRHHFAAVRQAKPPASRKKSAESYVVARGFRSPAAE